MNVTDETKGKRAVLYLRVSSVRQREAESIKRQRQILPGMARRLGLKTVGDPYVDDGISGKTVDARSGLKTMLDDLPKVRPDFVMFLRPDRLGRPEDRQTLKALVDGAVEAGVSPLYLKEDEWTGDLVPVIVHHNNIVEVHLLEGELIRAGQENRKRGRDVRQGKFARLMQGLWPFQTHLYGFRWMPTERRFVPVAEEIDRLRWMFAEVVERGHGTPTIAAALRKEGVLTPKAAGNAKWAETLKAKTPGGATRWQQCTVRQLLDRPHYATGVLRFPVASKYPDLLKAVEDGRRTVGESRLTDDGCIEFPLTDDDGRPVVTKEVWQRAQEFKTSRHKRQGGQRRGERRAFLFGPWLRCACGAVYRSRTRRSPAGTGREWRYYHCGNRRSALQLEGRPYCGTPVLKADDVDGRLWDMLCGFLFRPSAAVRGWLAAQASAEGPDAAEIGKQITEKRQAADRHERKADEWEELFDATEIDKAKFLKRTRPHKDAADALRAEVAALKDRRAAVTVDSGRVNKLLALYERNVAAVADDLKARLDALPWHAKRTLLHRVMGTNPITLVSVNVGSVRSIWRRRQQDADALMAAYCVRPAADGETEGLFIEGVQLPARPTEILDAMAVVGVRPAFYTQRFATGTR